MNNQPPNRRKKNEKRDAFFYHPQIRLQRFYKESRANAGHTIRNVNRNQQNGRSRLSNTTVRPIALGRNNNNNNNNNGRNQFQLKGSRTLQRANVSFENFLETKPNQKPWTVVRKSLGPRRAYVAHFNTTTEPGLKKAQLLSKRACDLQGYVDEIHNNRFLKAKIKEYKILKYGTEEEKSQILNSKRTYWFEFTEGEQRPNKGNNSNSNSNSNNNDDDTPGRRREYLGKLKKDDANYTYAIFEWDKATQQANVYPCHFIEFGLKNSLLARGEANSEMYERMARKRLQQKQKYESEQFTSVFSQLGKLFGHDKPTKEKEADPDAGVVATRDPKTGKMVFLDPRNLKSDKEKALYDKMKKDNKDFASGTRASKKIRHLMGQSDRLRTTDAGGQGNTDAIMDSGVAGGADTEDLIHNAKSKRLNRHKTRGAMEELADYDRDFSDDDGDEINANDDNLVNDDLEDHDLENQEFDFFDGTIEDVDAVDDDLDLKKVQNPNAKKKKRKKKNDDDDEFDLLGADDDDDDDDGSSSEGEEFAKLENLAENTGELTSKDFEVPLPEKKAEGEDGDDDENKDGKDKNKGDKDDDEQDEDEQFAMDGNNDWMQISDDEDDDDDDNVNGMNSNKNKNKNKTKNNSNNNAAKTQITGKKRGRPGSGSRAGEMNKNKNNSNNNNSGGAPAAKRAKIATNGANGAAKNKGGGGNSGGNNSEFNPTEVARYGKVLGKVFEKTGSEELASLEVAKGARAFFKGNTFNQRLLVRAMAKYCEKTRVVNKKSFWRIK